MNTKEGDTELDIARVPNEDVIIYNSAEWIIVIPLTHRSAMYWGRDSNWDTSWAGGEIWFDQFSKQGNLIVIQNKIYPEMLYQFHIESSLFFDKENKAVIFAEFFSKHPELRKAVIDHLQEDKQLLHTFQAHCLS